MIRIIKTKVELRSIIGFLALLILILIMGGNNVNLDFQNYEYAYNHLNQMKGFEVAYFAVQQLGNVLGLDFLHFKLYISLICLVVIHLSIKRYHFNTPGFYFLYFLYPFLLDVIEIRNFIGLTLLIVSVQFLRKPDIRSKLIYVAIIVLATLFHNVFIVFLPLVLFDRLDTAKGKKWVLIVAAILSIIMMLTPNLVITIVNSFFDKLSSYGILEIRTSYAETVQTRFGFLLFFAKQIVCLIVSYYEVKLLDSLGVNETIGGEEHTINCANIIRIVYFLNIYAFIFCPLYRINGQFSRIMQSINVLSHISFCATMQLSKGMQSKSKSIVKWVYILFVLFNFITVILVQHYNDIFVTVLTNNWIV